jgi:hypothetical protein
MSDRLDADAVIRECEPEALHVAEDQFNRDYPEPRPTARSAEFDEAKAHGFRVARRVLELVANRYDLHPRTEAKSEAAPDARPADEG